MPRESRQFTSSIWTSPPTAPRTESTLSREQIVRTAVELLDEAGLAGMSMRRLGTKLDAGAASIYWYVATKDQLLELAADEVVGEIDIPDPDAVGWRAGAGAVAHGMRAVILRHRWMAALLGRHPMMGPHAMGFGDRAVAVMAAAGFTGPELNHALSLLMSYAIGSATTEAAVQAATAGSGKDSNELTAELAPHVDRIAADYPNLGTWWRENKHLDMAAMRVDGFAFGLERLLDGLEAWRGRTA